MGAIFDAHAPARFDEEVDSVGHEIVDAAKMLGQETGVECFTLVLESESPYEEIIEAAWRYNYDQIFMAYQ
ncbi:MAG: hypothetical protein WCL27_06905 [Betaproteobacteria bacterium]